MNVEKIRSDMQQRRGETLKFKFNGARNQTEEFEGKIINTYPAVFIIKLNDEVGRIKSFTYSDVLIENLEILN